MRSIYSKIAKYFHRITYIPNSFFDVRSAVAAALGFLALNIVYNIAILKATLLDGTVTALFTPLLLLATLFIYSKMLGNLKKELLIPRRWVNYGAIMLVVVAISEKLLYDYLSRTPGINLAILIAALVTIMSFVFNTIMNLWLKMSDKNLLILQHICDSGTLYRAVYDYAWQWLDWTNALKMEHGRNVKTFVKNFQIRQAADFFDNYVTLTPYVVAYGTPEVVAEYKNIMLQLVAINNIRNEIIIKGHISDLDIQRLQGRRGDMLLSLELLMVGMKAGAEDLTEEQRQNLLDLLRAREDISTLKNRILF
jgi:hypothetical protein